MVSADRFRSTASFVGEINKRLCDNSLVQSGGGFITLFYAAIDTEKHTMTWSSAGHPLAMLHNLETDEVTNIGNNDDSGLPLGISDFEYTAATVDFPINHRVLIYSDGLTDAFSPKAVPHRLFGLEGISRTLKECRAKPVTETLHELFQQSRAYTEGAGRHDDTSVVLVERYE
jgi:phosphoserine phosphatase RsbU/P